MAIVRGITLHITTIIIFAGQYCRAQEWTHSIVLDPEGLYHVHWNTHDDVIDFYLEVQTKGYVGLGLSKTGAMAGSDIVTGWVADGIAHSQDRHGLGNFIPEIDAKQDWELLFGKENDTHTILRFRRKLQTCDRQQDQEIDQSTMRLIYAFSDEDPPSPEKLQYHGAKRGSRSVLLLQPDLKEDISTESLPYWDVLSPNYTISSERHTMYWCNVVKGPELQKKHHVVKIKPVIQPGNEGYVHHLLIYECVGAIAERFEPHVESGGHECYHPNMPDVLNECDAVIFAWAIGGEDIVLPEHVGMSLIPSPPKYYMLEIHYDNPSLHGGLRDESGVRFFYTPDLRKYDASVLQIGSAVSPRMVIPPRQERFTVSGHTHPDCLGPVMPAEGVKVLSVILHAHLLGRRIKVRHFRGEEELPPLADNANFDFNFQEYLHLAEEVRVLPNDHLTVECTYNSTERQFTTFGGLSTREEMCLAFLLYYPRIERFGSISAPRRSLVVGLTGITESAASQDSYAEYITEMMEFEWKNLNIPVIEKAMMYSPQVPYCQIGDGNKTSVTKLVSYPANYKPYKKADACPEGLSVVMGSKATISTSSYFAFAIQFAVVQSLYLC